MKYAEKYLIAGTFTAIINSWNTVKKPDLPSGLVNKQNNAFNWIIAPVSNC